MPFYHVSNKQIIFQTTVKNNFTTRVLIFVDQNGFYQGQICNKVYLVGVRSCHYTPYIEADIKFHMQIITKVQIYCRRREDSGCNNNNNKHKRL